MGDDHRASSVTIARTWYQGLAVLDQILRLHPALPLLAGLLAGILPVAATSGWGRFPLAAGAGSSWSLLALLLVAMLLRRQPLAVAKFASCLLVGAMGAWLTLHPGRGHLHRELPSGPCGVEMEAVVADPTAAPDAPDWLPNPGLLEVRLRRWRLTADEPWRTARGRLATVLPPASPRLGFGDRIRLTGTCAMPEGARFPGDYDFRRHLLTRGIWRMVYARDCVKLQGPDSTWTLLARNVLRGRDWLLTRLTASCRQEQDRQTLAALLFGCRQGMDAADRQAYAASGTIHIFAISGLHVGIVALLLLWGLRWLPFRVRHLVVPVMLTLYVFTTGCQPAAVRALLMIGLWLVQRAFLRPVASLNAVFLAAWLILLFQPLACLGAGFQFSFVVAGFLVLTWQAGKSWPWLATGGAAWVPARLLTRRRLAVDALRRRFGAGLTACLIAWLASLGVGLAQNGYFAPSAPLANLAVLPLVSALFAVIAGQLLLLPFPVLGAGLGRGIELLLGMIRAIAGHGGLGLQYWLPPSLVGLLLFYLALLAMITASSRRVFFPAAAGLVGIMFYWHVGNLLRPPALLIVHGGGSEVPCLALCPGGGRPPVLVNAPGHSGGARFLRSLLATEGIREIDTLLLPAIRREHVLGGDALLAETPVRRVLLPSSWRHGGQTRSLLQAATAAGVEVEVFPAAQDRQRPGRCREAGLELVIESGSEWQLTWSPSEFTIVIGSHEIAPGRLRLTWQCPGHSPRRLDLVRQNQRNLFRLPLDRRDLTPEPSASSRICRELQNYSRRGQTNPVAGCVIPGGDHGE